MRRRLGGLEAVLGKHLRIQVHHLLANLEASVLDMFNSFHSMDFEKRTLYTSYNLQSDSMGIVTGGLQRLYVK